MADISFSNTELIKKGSETKGFDPRKLSKRTTAIALLCGVGLLFWYFLLPFLLTIAWGTLELVVVGGITAFIIALVAANWQNITYFNEFIAKRTFGIITEWDPFLIQELQIKNAEKDIEKMYAERVNIEAEYIRIDKELLTSQKNLEIAVEGERIARAKGDDLSVADMQAEQARAIDFIQNVTPLKKDMEYIIEFVKEGYVILKSKIKNARADLKTQKSIFDVLNAGSSALSRMQNAMIGDVKLNNDAEIAAARVLKRNALSIGQMRVSMDIISNVTRQENLRDAATLARAKQQLKTLNIANGTNDSIPLPTAQPGSFNQMVKLSDNKFPID